MSTTRKVPQLNNQQFDLFTGAPSASEPILSRALCTTLHEASLTHDFFESLTRSVLQACRSSSQRVAGDGTVIEAACSHYKLLKEEAVKSQAKAAREALAQAPADPNAQQAEREARECSMMR